MVEARLRFGIGFWYWCFASGINIVGINRHIRVDHALSVMQFIPACSNRATQMKALFQQCQSLAFGTFISFIVSDKVGFVEQVSAEADCHVLFFGISRSHTKTLLFKE